MLDHMVGFLRCPHCAADVALADRSVRCPRGHAFDVARQGYVSLLAGRVPTGRADTAAMVAARAAFLDAGHYGPLTAAVTEACAEVAGGDGCVVDVGAGTGHHLAAALERLPRHVGLALDVSKHALRRAARAHARAGAVGCDVWRELPVRDGGAAVALSVFAPRNGVELGRVLRPGGAAVVVTPTSRHLAELVGPLGLLEVDERKRERLDAQLGPHLGQVGERSLDFGLSLRRQGALDLVGMGPSAWHVDESALSERLAGLPEPIAVTASLRLSVHRRP